MLSLILAASFVAGIVVADEGGFGRQMNTHHAERMLPNALQNMCGASYSAALGCGAACPGGTDGECPAGQNCYAEVPDCPLPPTISPKPTRSPVPGFELGNHDKQVIGYYASWQWYDRAKLAKPTNMDFTKVTRVNYAFFQLDEDGNIWGTDEWADPRVLFGDLEGTCQEGAPGCRCSWVKPQYKSCSYHQDMTGLIWRVHQARAEIYPSIGGWTLSDTFSPMAADPVSRRNFARKCRNLIEDYDFDGLDLDWEYPGYTAHNGKPEDTQNFNLLLEDIRRELDELGEETGRYYGLTAALPCGPSNINNIDIQTVSEYLSEFNLMTYDFHGAWDTYAGTNSPLYDQSNDSEARWSVDGCVKNWVERGAPQQLLNIGLAFYGRSFRNAKELGAAHGGTDDNAWAIDEGTPQYFNIMDKIDGMTVVWNEETRTPYAYFDNGGMVSYDDERSICLKTEYAIKENLQGFIIWELSGGIMDDLNSPLLDIVNRKLSETDTNCADPFGPKLNSPITPNEVVTSAATVTPEGVTTGLPNTTTGATATSTTSTTRGETATSSSAASNIIVQTQEVSSMEMQSFMESVNQFYDGRQKVVRNTNKPGIPYRPPRESLGEL